MSDMDKPDGGPAEYYDFPKGALTLNDLIEYKEMDFHRGNIFKAVWRWGEKKGTPKSYDARKIIYSGARLLMKYAGVKELRDTLQKMLDDPQFKERTHERTTTDEEFQQYIPVNDYDDRDWESRLGRGAFGKS